jgi:23S rRNA A1618 N6-methylase RlmF
MKKDPIKLKTIENANAIVRGKEIPNGQLDMVICDPPQYSNINDKLLNNWKNKEAERRKEKYGLITWRSMGFETDTDSTDTDDQEGF